MLNQPHIAGVNPYFWWYVLIFINAAFNLLLFCWKFLYLDLLEISLCGYPFCDCLYGFGIKVMVTPYNEL